MNTRTIKVGTTDVSVVIRIVDSTDGTPEVGVVFNTSGIDLQYRRELADSVAITEATLAALTTAHADGGFLHIGNGYYRLDLPDAACAAGATGVLVHGTVTGMVVIGCYVELVSYDPYATNMGMTFATQASVDTIDDFLDTEVAAIKAKTDQLTFTVANQVDVNTLTIAAAQLTAIADAMMKRDMSAITGESDRSLLNAIRFLRNKWTLTAGTLSVKKEDDATEAWNAAVTTDAAAVPIIGSDPA